MYEATITRGPLEGARAVAKRALKRREGKIKWRKRNWDSVSIEKSSAVADLSWTTYYNLKTNSGDAAAAAPGANMLTPAHSTASFSLYSSSASSLDSEATQSDAEQAGLPPSLSLPRSPPLFLSLTPSDAEQAGSTEAAAYLEVEDHINRLISVNCPEVAAPYIGDCLDEDGARWLVWIFEVDSATLASHIKQAHKEGSMQGLAGALGVEGYNDEDPLSVQRLVTCLASQMLWHCAQLASLGVCHRCVQSLGLGVHMLSLSLSLTHTHTHTRAGAPG